MKGFVLSVVASIASVVAFLGVAPASLCTLHQPKVPQELLK